MTTTEIRKGKRIGVYISPDEYDIVRHTNLVAAKQDARRHSLSL